jgi:two-component system NtrC family sensor kinase
VRCPDPAYEFDIAHEINNPQAIIIATAGVIRDMLNPEFGIAWNRQDVFKELDTINTAVFRAKNITGKLLEYGRKNEPHVLAGNVNNAGDAIKGSGTITVTTEHTADSVKITITDTGIVTSIDLLKQIFNPYYTTYLSPES